ncbi:MAG: hypothetical protein UHO61_08200 [Acutalibacteraceae bacterium]|nr:hypothetical protein [Acutalibacteraceae bacterium]
MFNFIYYGKCNSWSFYGSSAGSQHIDLREEGIKKFILPNLKKRGYSQIISINDKYSGDFKEQLLKLKKENGAQVCEIKEENPENGYTLTYYIFIEKMKYDVEFNQQELTFDIFAFEDFDKKDTTDELPV